MLREGPGIAFECAQCVGNILQSAQHGLQGSRGRHGGPLPRLFVAAQPDDVNELTLDIGVEAAVRCASASRKR